MYLYLYKHVVLFWEGAGTDTQTRHTQPLSSSKMKKRTIIILGCVYNNGHDGLTRVGLPEKPDRCGRQNIGKQ